MEDAFVALGVLVLAGLAFLALGLPLWCLLLLYQVRRRQEALETDTRELRRALLRELGDLRALLGAPRAPVAPAPAPGQPAAPAPAPAAVAPAPAAVPSPVAVPAAAPPVRLRAAAAAAAAVHPPPPAPARAPVEPEPDVESGARHALRRAWNWLVVGEEFRRPGASFEFAFASNWLLRLGVVAVVVGIGFFLKYSIDKGLLGPSGRVALSVLAGAGMVAAGVRLLGRRYHIMGQGLLGGGLATLYFSVFAAHTLFHLVGTFAAFALMGFITASAGVLAVRFNSLLVALLGILGGYATPLLLPTGEKNLPGLFGYLLVLGVGVLGVACRRSWPLLTYLAMLGTYLLSGLALHEFYGPGDFALVLPFLTAFFVLFSTTVFLYNVARREPCTLLELLGLLLNAGLFFGFGYGLIEDAHGRQWTAALTLALAAFYTAHLYVFLWRRLHDRGLMLSFTALAALFLTLTMPLLLSAQWITAAWALQALAMLWLAGKLDSRFLRQLACAVYLLVLYRFCFLDLETHFRDRLPSGQTFAAYLPLLLERLLLFGVPLASLALAARLLRTPLSRAAHALDRADDVADWVRERWLATAFLAAGVGLLFLYLQFELHRTLHVLYPPLAVPALTLVWVGLCALVLGEYRRHASPALMLLFILTVTGTALKFLLVDLGAWQPSLESLDYAGAYSVTDGAMRLLDFGLLTAFLAGTWLLLRGAAEARPIGIVAGAAALLLLFVYLTLETNTALRQFVPGLRAGGVSILWSAYALALLVRGIRRGVRPLRYVGLVLFAVVVAKVFLSDLEDLDAVYRILASIVLGVLLLCGSFVYLKYRQRFAPDEGDGVAAPPSADGSA